LFLGEEATNFCCFFLRWYQRKSTRSEAAGGKDPP
jgi:hypothetical protein